MAGTRRPSLQTRVLLEELAAAPDDWRHGYELARATGLKSGTLYPLLIRLADRGYLEARWEAPGDGKARPRHLYRLTATGRAYATAAGEPRPQPIGRTGLEPA